MIRFCDKEVYGVDFEEAERTGLLTFFLDGHVEDIVVVNKDGAFYGVIQYQRLLYHSEKQDYIFRGAKKFDCDIWENARPFFEKYPKDYLPLVDEKGELVFFAYNDSNIEYVVLSDYLSAFEEAENIKIFIKDLYPQVQAVCISDINEAAYRFYHILKKQNIDVVLIWEK